jgi:hypothetical protein
MKDKGDMVKKRIQEAKVIENIRAERLNYLEKEYPKAIAIVAKLAFQNKLRALDKQKSKIVNAQVNKSNRICMNTTCNGFLDPNFVCMTCETEFCNICEKKVKQNHVCKQEDLDSVNIINNMIKCPGCTLPVFKDEGCDSITCSNCSTNFQYSTGKEGGHGSHNAKLQTEIFMNRKERLSNVFIYKLDKDCLKLLLTLESLEPQFKSKDIILSPLKAYFKNGDEDLAAIKIAVKIDEYYNFTIKYKQFQILLTKFEEKVNNEENKETLKTYLKHAIKELRS